MEPQAPSRQTQTQQRNAETQSGSPEGENLLTKRLVALVSHIGRSEEYRTLRSQNIPHTVAYSGAIEAIISSQKNGFNSLDSALLSVTASLGTFIEAYQEVDSAREDRAKRSITRESSAMNELKCKYLIPFNHLLKLLINEGSNLSINQLSEALTRVHTAVFAPYNALHPDDIKLIEDTPNPSMVLNELKQCINAMRHEVAAESMLSAAGIEYDYAVSVEEDARGVDIIVYIDGKRIPIDIKSSRQGVSRAFEKRSTAHAVYTGLEAQDFTGMRGAAKDALCIPYSVAQSRAPSFVEDIRAVAQM